MHRRRHTDIRRESPARCGLLLISALAVSALAVGGCGKPPELRQSAPGGALPGTTDRVPADPGAPVTSAPPITIAPVGTDPVPSPTRSTAFPTGLAVDCAGRPTADRIVALLRRTDGLLPANAQVSVRMAPRCAGSWQYTVVQVPDREPLQVVTEGSPTAVSLVTAGTNVCTIAVRVNAPAGIRTLACDSVTIPLVTP
ncbi:hypothetical protein ACN27F_19500 [Solwaraspora sp. WMMB335]|uniref:hypothetical protein n=1 Tax=Solwaraspora sp. WMMB335 TaxID=3404118 RepID=UPI003B924539